LCFLEKRGIAFRLVELVEDLDVRKKLRKVCTSSIDDAKKALRNQDLDAFETWIKDPTSRSSFNASYYYWRWINGELDDEIETLKDRVKSEVEAGEKYKVSLEKFKKKTRKKKKDKADAPKPPEQELLRELIGVLRFQRRDEEALQYANKIANETNRRNLTHTILMENGNWSKLQTLFVSEKKDEDEEEKEEDAKAEGEEEKAEDAKDKKPPKDGLAYTVDGYAKALIEFYAGDEEAFRATLKKIKDDLKTKPSKNEYREFLDYIIEREPEDEKESDGDKESDVEKKSKDQKKKPKKDDSTFDSLASQRRYDELFDVFGWDTVEQRMKYFRRKISTIKSLVRSAKMIREARRVFDQLDKPAAEMAEKLDARRQRVVGHYQKASRLLASLGMTEEAEFYWRRLYFELAGEKGFDFVPRSVVMALQRMGAYESAFEIAELEWKRSGNDGALSWVLEITDQKGRAVNRQAISALNSKLKDSIEDPLERSRLIATLVKSPAAGDSWKGLDIWAEFERLGITFEGGPSDQLFRIWHVDEHFFSRSLASSEPAELALQCVASGDFVQAGQLFEAMAFSNDSHSQFGKAAWAYRQAGNEPKARVMQMHEFNGQRWQTIAFDAMRLYDCLRENDIGENCYYMWRMTEEDESENIDPFQVMIRTQLLRLYYIDSPYFEDSELDIPRFVRGEFSRGNVKAAANWYRKILKYRAADAGLCESVFPLLIQKNQTETLDELFQATSADFYKVLSRFPDSPLLLNNYAWVCAKANKNLDGAIELSKKSVKLRPGNPAYRDTLAELHFLNGQKKEAIDAIRRAVELDPVRPRYREQLEKFEGKKRELTGG